MHPEIKRAPGEDILSIGMSIYRYIYISIVYRWGIYVYISVYLSVYLSGYLSVFVSVYLTVCIVVILSVGMRMAVF